jgi:hypothetical protein
MAPSGPALAPGTNRPGLGPSHAPHDPRGPPPFIVQAVPPHSQAALGMPVPPGGVFPHPHCASYFVFVSGCPMPEGREVPVGDGFYSEDSKTPRDGGIPA